LFSSYLGPALDVAMIPYDKFETQSPDWIGTWVKNLDSEAYTDFVVIGGDGIFNQFINACYSHNQTLLAHPIGILPGGS
jgi:diacylglycerol kinase family enzyme